MGLDVMQKVELLVRSAQYDVCVMCGPGERRRVDDLGRWIYSASLPDGRVVKLLKILQSNLCRNNCRYCAQRSSRDTRRTTFSPDELAAVFDEMYRKGLVEGLFLSSAIMENPIVSMDRTLATVELLRKKYQFRGYIHLKMLPGITMAHVEQAVRLATRVSLNLEAPTGQHLAAIAPDKDYTELLKPLIWARDLMKGSGGVFVPGGQTTQFVVGAAGESDRDILSLVTRLYRDIQLRRAYYSAFQPVEGTPLEGLAPTPLIREHRLYEADFLLRTYGFRFSDLVFDEHGNLPRETDPKQAWADQHPEMFPIEVNRASREELLRVPGIGPRSAQAIVEKRIRGLFHSLRDLERIGVLVRRAAPYILLNGKRLPYQLPLLEEAGQSGKTLTDYAVA